MSHEFMRGENTCPGHDTIGEFVARGNDSRVYRVGGKIHKIYDQDLLAFMLGKEKVYAQVAFYFGITNGAASLAEVEDWQISLPYLDKFYPLRIHRVTSAEHCRNCGVVVGVSEEIKGPHLEEDPRFSDKDKLQEALEVTGEWIGFRLRLNGIYLAMNNVKMTESGFVVTDLASIIAGVKPNEFSNV